MPHKVGFSMTASFREINFSTITVHCVQRKTSGSNPGQNAMYLIAVLFPWSKLTASQKKKKKSAQPSLKLLTASPLKRSSFLSLLKVVQELLLRFLTQLCDLCNCLPHFTLPPTSTKHGNQTSEDVYPPTHTHHQQPHHSLCSTHFFLWSAVTFTIPILAAIDHFILSLHPSYSLNLYSVYSWTEPGFANITISLLFCYFFCILNFTWLIVIYWKHFEIWVKKDKK